jgi:SAM-dependent methyltransferase
VTPAPDRDSSYGEQGLSPVDRLGVWLSLRAVRRHVGTGGRLLDLGCGYEAGMTRALTGRWRTATVVDVSLAPGLGALDGVTPHEGTLEEVLPRLDETAFDTVLLVNVLEHVRDPALVLGECRRVLASGGVLLVNVPTWLGKRALETAAFRLGVAPAVEMDDHKAYYAVRDLWPLLVAAGFRPRDLRLRYHKGGLNLLAVARAG